jgi:hypothetical protein
MHPRSVAEGDVDADAEWRRVAVRVCAPNLKARTLTNATAKRVKRR